MRSIILMSKITGLRKSNSIESIRGQLNSAAAKGSPQAPPNSKQSKTAFRKQLAFPGVRIEVFRSTEQYSF